MMAQVVGAFLLVASMNSFASAEVGKWIVSQPNITCLIVEMDIKVNFSYIAKDNTTKAALYQIPANATTDVLNSSCGKNEDTLRVSWPDYNSFEMKFNSNKSLYDLSSFVINLNVSSLFNDSQANQTVSVSYINESYKIHSNFSYHCNRQQTLNATNGKLELSKVQFEAFKTDNSQKFSAAQDCDSSLTPDIVPIAVGISLIALIVVVLIAYIVGRKRQQARGYLNIM